MTDIMEDATVELQVVKRNGKKVDFDGTKIAMTIKKGFDSLIPDVDNATLQDVGYSEKDINKVYHAVMDRIKKEFKDEEYRVIVNCGENGGQEVMHLHFHILAGTKLGEKIV